DRSGEETEVSDRGDEPRDGRTAVVRAGAQARDAGRVFREAPECISTKCDSSRLCGHVEAVPAKPGGVGATVSEGIRQVSHSAACEPSGRRSAAGRVLPPRRAGPGSGTGQALAAADQLAQPRPWETTPVECSFFSEPAHSQNLSPQKEPCAVLEQHHPRDPGAPSAELDRPVARAAAEADGEAGAHVTASWRAS